MSPSQLPEVTIYTDGACNPNPGPGGWAAILLFPGQPPQEINGSEPDTTNNRMELRAALEALQRLERPHRIQFYTDSKYLKQGITEWLPRWQARNWQTSSKTDVKNQGLWQGLADQLGAHQISWRWTKGHAGDRWNERADDLARAMIPQPELPLEDEQAVHLFTAASYRGKQKRGGWGVVLRYQEHEKHLSGSERNSSGNRMHLRSAIEGLTALKTELPVHLYTSSDYLKDGATAWVKKWRARGWTTQQGKPVSHRDLWEALTALTHKYPITWHVVSKQDAPPEMKQAKDLANAAAQGE